MSILLIWLISAFDSSLEIAKGWRWSSAGFFVLLGLAVDFSSVVLFFKSKTTVNPLKPSTSKELVTEGFFNYSRNPMYLGMVLIALGVVCYFGSPMSLIAVVCFIYYITRFQIVPEERAMLKNFGDQYLDYQRRVRRWI
ncbi:MAG: isoprenylcysteine carboxylmethyltransferase family protein [Acidiferrobacterales bacterium]|nr:isoprenylcysteine carboxylmethyltransferase family protein [Acidiferrobacterales bacterium]